MRKTILATLLALALIGCSDPKEASEKNFEASIQRFLDSGFPVCVIRQNFPVDSSGYSFHNNFKVFDEMTKVGLLNKIEEMKKPNKYSKPINVATYNLTEEGKKYYQQNAGKNLRNDKLGGFCFGKAKVEEIIDFTEPADMFGATLSSVNFTYSVTNVPDWAKKLEITSQNEQIKKLVEATEKPVKGEAKLVLTNKGWKHTHQDSLDEAKVK